MRINIYLILVTIFMFSNLFADYERPVLFYSMRSMAMGNSFIASPEDSTIMYFNPAGLKNFDRFRFSYKFLAGGVNDYLTRIFSLPDNEEIKRFINDEITWEEVSETIKNKLLRAHRFRIDTDILRTGMVIPAGKYAGNIGIGLNAFWRFDTTIDPGIFVPTVDTLMLADAVFTIGTANTLTDHFKKIPGKLTVGGTFNFINRVKVEEYFSLFSSEEGDGEENKLEDIIKIGSGMSFNIGALYQLPKIDNLTFSAVIPDFTCTTINWNDGTKTMIDTSLNLGVAWKPTKIPYWKNKIYNPKGKLTITGEIDGIFSGGDYMKKTHAGLEYKLPALSLRMGFNQGWFCWGFKFLGFIEYTFFQEELGSYAGAESFKMHYFNFTFGF